MPRPPIAEEKVRAAIAELHAAGEDVTVSAVRARVGTGSFTTIGAIVAAWRREQSTQESIPTVPDRLGAVLGQIWTEAWRDASKLFDAERTALAAERSALEREKKEMEKEIERLEVALATASEELQELKAINTGLAETVTTTQTKLAKEEAAAEVLKSDLREVKEELKQVRSDLTSWIERGTKAETALASGAQAAGARKEK